MGWKRWLGFGLLALVVVLLVLWGFRPQPVAVEFVRADLGPMRVTIEEEGKTRVKDRFVVHAPLSGYARRISLEVGDHVNAGQLVTILEPQPQRSPVLDPRTRAEGESRLRRAENAVVEARARVDAAQADATYWNGQIQRIESLVKSGDLSRESLDRARAEKDRTHASVDALRKSVLVAESEVETARVVLHQPYTTELRPKGDMVRVTSPVSGRVLRVARKSEGPVQAGDALVELGDALALEVEVEVLSADAVKLGPQTRVTLERWGGPKPLQGQVRYVEPTAFTKISALGVEEQRARVIADISSAESEWDRLGDGYRVEASFILWEQDRVLRIPASALFRWNDGWAVFVRDGEMAKRVAVKVGHRNGLQAEILEGLAESTEIVRHPDDTIEDGTLVTPRDLK